MPVADEWVKDCRAAEAFSLRMREVCATVPLRGSWEPNDRIALAMAAFRLSQEHHSSIHLLTSHGKYASANALARPMLETSLRTVWIAEGASAPEIASLLKQRGKLPLLKELDIYLRVGSKKALPGKSAELLHTLTHGGMIGLAAQFFLGEDLERAKAVMIVLSGSALGIAGSAATRSVGREDLCRLIEGATP